MNCKCVLGIIVYARNILEHVFCVPRYDFMTFETEIPRRF